MSTIITNLPYPTTDTWDKWFIIKTFGPGMLTSTVSFVSALIAIAAWRVNNYQKVINSKKFDLDLFDKRYPLFLEIEEVYKNIKNIKINKSRFPIDYNNEKYVKEAIDISVENDLSITKFDTNEIKKLYKTLDKSWRLYNELPEGIIGELKCSVNNFDEQKIKYENFVKKFICSEKDVRGILQSNFYKLSNKYIDNSISSINTHIEDLQGRINNLKEKNMDAIDLENSVVMIREQKLRVGENTPEIEEDISTFNDKANECLKIIISITYNIEKIRDIMGKHLIIWN